MGALPKKKVDPLPQEEDTAFKMDATEVSGGSGRFVYYPHGKGTTGARGDKNEASPNSASQSDRGKVLTKTVLRSAKFLGLSDQQLADSIGVSKVDISRFRRGESSLKEGSTSFNLGVLLVRAYCSLDDIADGDKKVVRAWMKAEDFTLGDQPINLITEVEGLIDVAASLATRQSFS